MTLAKQLLPIICASLLLSACSTGSNKSFVLVPPSESQIEDSIKNQVSLTLNAFTPVAGQALPNETVLDAYQSRDYEPVWIKDEKINMSIYKLVDVLEQSHTHGLNPIHYHSDIIKEYLALKQPSSQQLAEMDVIATIALTSYAHDLSNGRYEPQLIDPNWQLDAPNNNWKEALISRLCNRHGKCPAIICSTQPAIPSTTKMARVLPRAGRQRKRYISECGSAFISWRHRTPSCTAKGTLSSTRRYTLLYTQGK
ncbi:hypothetical protein AB8616_03910 [Marinomonas sp. RS-M-Aa-14]|uniref:hypothetical protein n=1 Tax=Marinomonas sp. RS-M-Aa-14 TaxID=3241169 RepID=UPI003AABB479